MSSNGNPSGPVRMLIHQLQAPGSRLRYHGDFDPLGLAMCARMWGLGVEPWRMTSDDYRAAIEAAEASGVRLPAATTDAGFL